MAIKLDVKDFEKMVNACKRTTSKDMCRPILHLINIDVKGDKLRMWSLDGYRIEIDEIEVKSDKDFKASFENMYIPKFNNVVTIDLIENNLEVTFHPSEFKIVVPQNFQGELWKIDSFVEDQQKIERHTVTLRKEYLEDALKKASKRDLITIRKQDGDVITPIEVVYKQASLKMRTYVLPVKTNV